MFDKRLIHCYERSYIFLIKINKFIDSARLSTKFIADEIYLENDINTIQMSSDENLPAKKKLKIGD